jgi:peptidoglycan/xylan/chitin deacetylase (PgdA/CDA1 family)
MLSKLRSKFNAYMGNKGLVLMYHRIHTPNIDPWQLSVSPENFEQQLQVLKRFYRVMPVDQFLEQRKANTLKKNSICLTFDDGYADNYQLARPLLLEYNCPATFFISSAAIDTNRLFWWDELAILILRRSKLPVNLTLNFPGEVFHCTIDQQVITDTEWMQINNWRYPQLPDSQRCKFYLALWQRLQPLPLSEIQIVLQQLRVWAEYLPSADPANYPMSSLQLASLFDSPLFSPGIHTASHPALGRQSLEMQKAEIQQCATYLKQFANGMPLPIAYPYGSYNDDTLSIVRNMGIKAGFTTSPSVVNAGSDVLRLGRFQVVDCGGAESHRQLKAWFAKGQLTS